MKKRDYDRIVKEEVAIPVCKRREMIEERYLRELLPPGRDSARRHSGKWAPKPFDQEKSLNQTSAFICR